MAHPLDLLHLGLGGEAALAVYIFPLVLAGISDFRTLRIPNYLTAALAAAFPLAALAAGQHVDWLSHIEAGFFVFAGGAVLFAAGFMGGGDVKLLAATALWAGLGQVMPLLAMVAIVGGASRSPCWRCAIRWPRPPCWLACTAFPISRKSRCRSPTAFPSPSPPC